MGHLADSASLSGPGKYKKQDSRAERDMVTIST